jgi:hypothetical protein
MPKVSQGNRPATAATDVPEFITDLSGGQFELILSQALSTVAAAVIDHAQTGEVTVKFKIAQIAGTHQVRLQHDVKFKKPTSMGSASEDTSGATVLHVGQYGALSLAQAPLFDKSKQGDLNV